MNSVKLLGVWQDPSGALILFQSEIDRLDVSNSVGTSHQKSRWIVCNKQKSKHMKSITSNKETAYYPINNENLLKALLLIDEISPQCNFINGT